MSDEPPAAGREPWTETVHLEVDGELVPVTISNQPPPGTPRRIYCFATPPSSADEAASLAEHIADLGQVLDEANSKDPDSPN